MIRGPAGLAGRALRRARSGPGEEAPDRSRLSRMRALLLLLPALLLLGCPVRREPTPEDDDDASADDDDASTDDDDSGLDDDDASTDDDDASADDDDASADDDDVSTDDDDATPDPAFCMLEALAAIEEAGILGPTTAVGDLPAQSIYSCETYQMLGVNLLAANAETTGAGSVPSWTLTGYPELSINDGATPATLSLTGCNPYTCDYYTNAMNVTASASLLMAEGTGPGNVPMLDIIFADVSHNAQAMLQPNSIFAGCSLGNLNEDLQANGVDIFDVVVNDLNPHIGVAIQLHLYDVEVAVEEASIACLAGP